MNRPAVSWTALQLPVATFILLLSACPQSLAQEWGSLFNGKDLSGWTVKSQPQDRDKVFWNVEDGAIVCDSMGRKDHNYVWLVSNEEFADFELRLKFQVYADSPGNSGLQFRSRFDDAVSFMACMWANSTKAASGIASAGSSASLKFGNSRRHLETVSLATFHGIEKPGHIAHRWG